jgi:hypothetical protein
MPSNRLTMRDHARVLANAIVHRAAWALALPTLRCSASNAVSVHICNIPRKSGGASNSAATGVLAAYEIASGSSAHPDVAGAGNICGNCSLRGRWCFAAVRGGARSCHEGAELQSSVAGDPSAKQTACDAASASLGAAQEAESLAQKASEAAEQAWKLIARCRYCCPRG